MGLDTTHDCWHGAYSAFNRWRDKLAEVADYTFHAHGETLKVGGQEVLSTTRRLVDLDWGAIEGTIGRDLLGRWPSVPVRHDGTPDPLIVLLAHPDDEGEIQADMVTPLADRLAELLPLLGDEDGRGRVGSYAEATRKFIDGLRRAAAAGEPVEFR